MPRDVIMPPPVDNNLPPTVAVVLLTKDAAVVVSEIAVTEFVSFESPSEVQDDKIKVKTSMK